MSDPFVGKLTYFRVYSGTLEAGSRVLNSTNGKTERIGRLLMMHANTREEIEQCYSGDILAGVGLKQTSTGDTLAAPDAPIILEQIIFPEPVIAVAIEPKTKVDQEKLATALQRLSEEDPTFRVESDEETGQTVINGMGELHLEVLVDRMMREFSVEATVGKPQVAYRETIRKEANKVRGKFVRQTGGSGQYGDVVINVMPNPGEGFEFDSKIKGGAIPTEFIPSIEKGIVEALSSGIKAGYPMVDVKVELIDGSAHDVDSSEMSFKIAGSMAIQEAAKRANPVLLEPVMEVEVVTPEEYLGDVIGDLSRRRGKLEGQEPRGNALVVNAIVPLSEMFGYVGDLRSATQGRASYTMQFARYEEVPGSIAEEIVSSQGGNARWSEPRRQARSRPAIFPGLPGPVRFRCAPSFRNLEDPQDVKKEARRRNVEGEVRARQAARQCRNHRSHRPWQDDPDCRDHHGSRRGPGWRGEELRGDRQRSRGEGARHHDRDLPRRVLDGQPPLRPRRLPGPRGLRQEHDHGRGPDGRGDPRRQRRRRPHAADA